MVCRWVSSQAAKANLPTWMAGSTVGERSDYWQHMERRAARRCSIARSLLHLQLQPLLPRGGQASSRRCQDSPRPQLVMFLMHQ